MSLALEKELFLQPLGKAEDFQPWQLCCVCVSDTRLRGAQLLPRQECLPSGRSKEHLTARGCKKINWEVSRLLTLCPALM